MDDVKVHPANPRRGDVAALRASIKTHGFYGALQVQRSTGFICIGNHRYLAAVDEGYLELPVQYHDIDDDTALQLLAIDNRASDLATYDERALAELLDELSDADLLAGTLYSSSDVAELLAASGIAGERASEFLDDLAEGAASTVSVSAGGEVLPTGIQPRQLVIVASPAERDEIIALVRTLREREGLATGAAVVLAALRRWADA